MAISGNKPGKGSASLYADIHRQIIEGTFRPGDLLTEAALTSTGGSADDRTLSLEEHARILEAVKARDGKRALEEMSLHANRSRDLGINALAQRE